MANENMIKFLRGNVASLPQTATAGALYFTKDEGIYMGMEDGSYHRYGDFITVADVKSLPATGAHATCMYYCTSENILARYDAEKGWIQINKQPTAEEMKTLLGLGTAAYTDADAYDAAGSAAAVRTYVGDIPNGEDGKPMAESVVAYINKKTDGIATSGNLEALGNRVTTAEGEIDALKEASANHVEKEEGKSLIANTEITRLAAMSDGANKVEASETNGSIKIDGVETVVYTHPEKHTISEVDGLQDALDGKSDDGHKHVAADITDLDATIKVYDYATKTEAQAMADAKVASVTAGDVSVTIGGTSTAPTVAAKLSADADNALTLAEDGLKVVIPAAAEYSIVKAENSGDYAAVYNLTKGGEIVGASINIPKDMVVESGSVVENPEGQAEGTYIELKLQNVTNPLYINVGNLIEYVTSGSATGDMVVIDVSDDHKVTATITDGTITLAKLTTEIQTAIGKAHSHENKDVIDGINADKVAAWDAAQAAAEATAAGALASARTEITTEIGTAISGEVSRADGKYEEKGVAQGIVDALKLGETYEPIGAESRAIAAAEGKVNALAGNVYTKAEVYTKTEVENLMSWGEF